MTKKRQKFVIVDGNAILHRAWHALPPTMTNKDGTVVNAVYGFLTTLFRAMKELKPDYLAVTFDRKEKTFRHEEYVEYKANREKQPDELYDQLPILKQVLEAMNIKIYEKAGFEADDVIGTLCDKKSVDRENILSVIVTGDMDALQLVDDNTEVYTMRKGMSDTVIYNEEQVKEKYNGLVPDQLIDYKGLRGDPSDNIPGVPGVGDKTAIGLMKQFGTMEKLYEKVEAKQYEHVKVTERIYNLLIDNKKQALLSKKLATIIRDVDLEFKLDETEIQDYDKDEVYALFQELEFKSLLNRLPAFGTEERKNERTKELKNSQHEYVHVNDEKGFKAFFQELSKQKVFVFDTETDGLDVFESKLLGIAFCWQEGKAFYVEPKKEWLAELKKIFQDSSIKKIGHNLKFDVKVLQGVGIQVENLYFDTMIASYLLNPGTRAHKLDDLVFRELGYQMTAITDLIGKGKGQTTLALVESEKVVDYACEDADYTWRLVELLQKELKENGLQKLFNEIEMPLIPVLVEMEMTGIKIDTKHLGEMSKKVGKKIDSLTKKIYKLAGQEFNIGSPKQLKEILFEKLNISTEGLSKTKTGVSTAAGELEKMRGEHPIIELIEDYRELAKLKSTYIDALPKLVCKKTGRVHTEFNQTVTATGRLSSSNPNLQNIPIRTELGREIRQAFVAEKGYTIIAADYSQVELRVIACLAKDETMMNVFKRGEDIHSVTASKIYNVPLEKVTKEMRYGAKEVNFGVLYGMGAWGLAARKKISRFEAQEFIKAYFKSFAKVKKYIDGIKEEAKKKGYVETIFGRKRYLPEINSGVQQIRASAERMAINMPIQGTAADLMKIAMIEVRNELKNLTLRQAQGDKKEVKMMLQVHDELVLEVPSDRVDEVVKIIDEKMEKIHKLCVPIKVDTEVGKNWQQLRSLY
jgi:DNA polymerase I